MLLLRIELVPELPWILMARRAYRQRGWSWATLVLGWNHWSPAMAGISNSLWVVESAVARERRFIPDNMASFRLDTMPVAIMA